MNLSRIPTHIHGLVVAAFLLSAPAAQATPTYIAGLHPSQRPAGAPTLGKDAEKPQPMAGVSQPVPSSITSFMKDQGNWYTPFTRPGMPGRYDIRGMHAPAAAPSRK